MPYADPKANTACRRRWAKKNPDKAKASRSKWAKSNPEKKRAANRRALGPIGSEKREAHNERRRARRKAGILAEVVAARKVEEAKRKDAAMVAAQKGYTGRINVRGI